MPGLLRSGTVARLRVPLGFLVAALVFYFSTPTLTSMAVGIPVAWIGLVFRAAAAGVIRKDAALARAVQILKNPIPASGQADPSAGNLRGPDAGG